MMLPAGKDESERLFARGYVPEPKTTGLPASFGITAALLKIVVLNGADQQLHENRTRESTMVRPGRGYIFKMNDYDKGLRSSDCGLLRTNVVKERGVRDWLNLI